jgi:hypothetical protein
MFPELQKLDAELLDQYTFMQLNELVVEVRSIEERFESLKRVGGVKHPVYIAVSRVNGERVALKEYPLIDAEQRAAFQRCVCCAAFAQTLQ